MRDLEAKRIRVIERCLFRISYIQLDIINIDQMKWISASVDGFDDLPTQFEDQPVTTKLCPVLKGHVHYHHSLTWHASHQNTSGRPRRAIAIHYMPQSTCYRAAGTHIMKPFAAVDDGEMLQGAGFPMVWPICSAT